MENNQKIIDHHELPICAGYTDIALLTLQICDNGGHISYAALNFASDGRCKIYFDADGSCPIPGYYSLEEGITEKGIAWIRVYDDEGAVMNRRCSGKGMRIYTAGNSAIVRLFDLEGGK